MSKVLIVEDNPDIARLYTSIFAEHQTVVLADVPRALEFLNHHVPDLVITDFHLPGGSGSDVITHIRQQNNLAGVPILGISVDDMWGTEAISQGASAFMSKPIDIQQLLNTSRALLTQGTGSLTNAPQFNPEAVLQQYKNAYYAVYRRTPDCYWTGRHFLIDRQRCDQAWLNSETERLRGLVQQPAAPRNALLRLIDKIRKI